MAKKDKLSIFEDRNGYTFYIGWLCWDEDFGEEEGLRLGEGRNVNDVEHLAAEQAVKSMRDGREGQDGSFFWESRSAAAKALKVAKEAIKNRERPLPEWAIKALAAGWKAPKGWQPE
jgi:hypothetical protein